MDDTNLVETNESLTKAKYYDFTSDIFKGLYNSEMCTMNSLYH